MLPARLASRLQSVDWDFSGDQSESRFSAIHWHPSRFASQVPATLIGLLSKVGDVILDPFGGSGTTLMEAQRLGRCSIGVDLNPLSCMIARAKTLRVTSARIRRVVNRLKDDAERALVRRTPSVTLRDLPNSVQAAKWYTPRVARQLGILWKMVNEYKGVGRLLAQTAFSAILITVCRETRHWGYICDNCAPTDDHEGDVLSEFSRVLDRFADAYDDRDNELLARFGRITPLSQAQIICGDAVTSLKNVPDSSVDLVLTSPPYFGVTDYIKTQRLSMEWFDQAIEPLRLKEIGARSKRHRREAVEQYIADLKAVFASLHRVMKPAALCAVVIGQSGSRADVLKPVENMIVACRFKTELFLKRAVSAQRRQTPSINEEHVVIYSREG